MNGRVDGDVVNDTWVFLHVLGKLVSGNDFCIMESDGHAVYQLAVLL
jgi:hypothetical protein